MQENKETAPKLKLSPEAIKLVLAALAARAVGLVGRMIRNAGRRARGQEPEPGLYAGVKRWARYHSRVASAFAAKPHIHPRHERVSA